MMVFLLLFVLLFLFACREEATEKTEDKGKCGDDVCDTREAARGLCPEDCEEPSDDTATKTTTYDSETYTYAPIEKESGWSTPVSATESRSISKTVEGVSLLVTDYAVENPTTEALLDVTLFVPADASATHTYPAVILVPGGVGSKEDFLKPISLSEDSLAETYAAAGVVVLNFSPDGRGDSTGEEDYNGYAQQAGLYELYRFLTELDGIDADSLGLVSYSYGVTMASGMLGRYQPDIKYYIEWEGPVNRWYTTFGCRGTASPGTPGSFSCDDEEHWLEREALRFVPYFPVDYFVIVQRENNHGQPTVQHSVDINNYAINYLDWVRVNGPENEINTKYTEETLPVLEGKTYFPEILGYMEELSRK
jgi:hypothetical protein